MLTGPIYMLQVYDCVVGSRSEATLIALTMLVAFLYGMMGLLDRLERMDIRAPASGIVYGLTVLTPRSVIRAAEPVMYLIPQDRPLIIAAQVSPINIDELFVYKTSHYGFLHWISARHLNCSVKL